MTDHPKEDVMKELQRLGQEIEAGTMALREKAIQSACMAARSNLHLTENTCDLCGFGPENAAPYCLQSNLYGSALDAILAALKEPSEGMYQAAEMELGILQIWQTMLAHIQEDGK